MTITKLFIYIGIVALLLLIGAVVTKRSKNLLINWIQFFVSGLFIFSGAIKAVDPLGTAFKLEEYFEVFVQYTPALTSFWEFFAHHALAVSIFMIVLEIFLGVALLFGQFVKTTLGLLVALMLFFTFLTGFSHFTQKVTDCGCFGDFMKLTPYQSFMKDILLTVLIFILVFFRKQITEIVKGNLATAIVILLTLLAIRFNYSNYFGLPIIDFRAYKVGVNIQECMTLPPDAKPTITEMTFIYKDNATQEVKEFDMKELEGMDFTKWTYVDRIDKIIQKGDEVKCKDFYIFDKDEYEVTEDILQSEKLFLISSYNIKTASVKGFKRMQKFAEEATKNGYTVIAVSSSSASDAAAFSKENGLTFPFNNLDAVPIKTMNRSNPGLMLLEKGTILGKWHFNNVKSFDKVMKSVQ